MRVTELSSLQHLRNPVHANVTREAVQRAVAIEKLELVLVGRRIVLHALRGAAEEEAGTAPCCPAGSAVTTANVRADAIVPVFAIVRVVGHCWCGCVM